MRVGIVQNRRSHRNRHGLNAVASEGALAVAPETKEALAEALRDFADAQIDLLVIDGGDGTVRDVLTLAPAAFGGRLPLLAVVPSGKTNALARDLGLPGRWSIEAAIAAAREGADKRMSRPVLQVVRPGGETLAGFIFGTSAFVTATRLTQGAHRMGLFNSVAVGAGLAGFIVRTLAGGRSANRGEAIGLGLDGEAPEMKQRFLVLASTMNRFPLKLRPFGPVRPGLKLLDVEAPPRRLIRALRPILAGDQTPWLEANGYHRLQGREVSLSGVSEFVLDGEILPGGDLMLREGPAVEFVTA